MYSICTLLLLGTVLSVNKSSSICQVCAATATTTPQTTSPQAPGSSRIHHSRSLCPGAWALVPRTYPPSAAAPTAVQTDDKNTLVYSSCLQCAQIFT